MTQLRLRTTRSGDLLSSNMACKQMVGSRYLLQGKCELVAMMAEACRGVQRKKLIAVSDLQSIDLQNSDLQSIDMQSTDLQSSDLQRSLIAAPQHTRPAAEAQYPSIQRPSVANHLSIREHTCLPYIPGAH